MAKEAYYQWHKGGIVLRASNTQEFHFNADV
jgi:hypothetical protein